MPFVIPKPIAMLPGGARLPVLNSLVYNDPREGKKYVPVEIDWDGAGTTYEVNVQGLTTSTFSQMIMFDVDNTQSGADVTFYFPDSTDTLTVPADSAGLFPIFTNGLLFYASSVMALASDVTRLRILNYKQEPIANPPPEFVNVATALNITTDGTTAIVAAGKSGTLTGYSAFVSGVGIAGEGSVSVTLKDHATGNVIDQGAIIVPNGGAVAGLLFNVTDTAIRFSSGLDVVTVSTGGLTYTTNVTVRYREP